MRYLLRFCLLGIGFALTTFGLMTWQYRDFSMDGLWPFAGEFRTHPLHLLVLGIAMIPPTLWELFLLENPNAVATNSNQHSTNSAPTSLESNGDSSAD